MFTDWFDYTIFLIFGFIELSVLLFIHFRINRKLGKQRFILNFTNMTFRKINFVMLFFVALFVILALIDIIFYHQYVYVIIWTLLFYLSFIILYKKINQFNYNDKGIIIPFVWDNVLGVEITKWEDILKVQFDRDIQQSFYDLNLNIKNYKKTIRCWIERKNLEELKNVFLKYNVIIE